MKDSKRICDKKYVFGKYPAGNKLRLCIWNSTIGNIEL